jgi:molecular chaperone GrpE
LSEDDPVDGPVNPEPSDLEVPAAAEAPETPQAAAPETPLQAATEASLRAALEPPPEPGAAEEFLRRARLAEDRLAEVLKAYRQVRSENDGFRDRITRNIERRFDHRRERLLLKFIDILDNLDRALEAAEQSYAGNPLIEGLILVRTSLLQTLQEEGLERIPVLGMPYDPNFSEAVATQPVDDPDQHHVVMKDMLRGYRLNGKVARASRVVVGEYGTKPAAPEEPEPLIGADEVPPGGLAAEAESPAAADEPSLEDLIARVQGEAGREEDRVVEAPRPEGDLPELEPDVQDPVSDETSQEPALLSEDDFALGEPVEEAAQKKPRGKPRGKARGSS